MTEPTVRNGHGHGESSSAPNSGTSPPDAMLTPTSGRKGPNYVLRVVDLTKRYGDLVAVDRLGLEVQRGEILGFLGPNGAGKTTALKMMCGLLRPNAGRVEIDGEPLVPGRAGGQRAIGVAPQDLVIWETLTCFEQLELVARLYGRMRTEARARAEHLLSVFGLADKAHRLGKTLSGGMQRRLNIALGLVHEPEVLFLDEPQAGLDPQSRLLVRQYIRALRGKMTVVITTHDMEEADKLADRVCILDRGKLLVLDTAERLKRQLAEGDVIEVVVDADVTRALLPPLERLAPQGTFSAEGNKLVLAAAGSDGLLAEVFREVNRQALHLVSIHTREATLEDVFIKLTGRSLRE